MPQRTPSRGFLLKVSELLGAVRWAFMPLGLFSLLAVGVHAAADGLDDQILVAVETWDAWMDGLLGALSWTDSWVDVVGVSERSVVARSVALVWELLADAVLALPAFGYVESATASSPALIAAPKRPTHWAAIKAQLLKPFTLMRVLRPLSAAVLCLAGACAVGRMVQGRLYLAWRELVGEDLASGAARMIAIAALLAVLATLGWRVVLRNLESADIAWEVGPQVKWRRWTVGFVGSLLVVPLAGVAWLSATPVLSFFR